nr:hypothetical protein KXZ65_08325 [Pectobacterium sp. PL152]
MHLGIHGIDGNGFYTDQQIVFAGLGDVLSDGNEVFWLLWINGYRMSGHGLFLSIFRMRSCE